MNWILKNFMESIYDVLDGFFETFNVFLNDLFNVAVTTVNKGQFTGIFALLDGIALVLIAVIVCKQYFSTYILETDGDPDSDPINLVERTVIAIALIVNGGYIFKLLTDTALTFGNELITNVTKPPIDNPAYSLFNILEDSFNQASQVVLLLFVIVYLIGTLILCFKAGLRAVELMFMKALFPLFCCDFVTSRRERFNAFMTSYLVTIFGYTFQIMFFRLSGAFCSAYMMKVDAENIMPSLTNMVNLMIAFGCLWFAIKTPKWLEKYVYTSGLGQTLGNGARTAAFMGPSMVRMFMK